MKLIMAAFYLVRYVFLRYVVFDIWSEMAMSGDGKLVMRRAVLVFSRQPIAFSE